VENLQDIVNLTKWPHTITRRDFNLKNIETWKASEYKNFFFYLAVPILYNFLPYEYIESLFSLVKAIRILYKLKNNEIQIAKELLAVFEKKFSLLYGEHNQSYTYHCVTKHLINDVKQHGSLAGHSLFALEGMEKYLKSKYKF
jgi:hypothetical protein